MITFVACSGGHVGQAFMVCTFVLLGVAIGINVARRVYVSVKKRS
jgi:hypothetical protein